MQSAWLSSYLIRALVKIIKLIVLPERNLCIFYAPASISRCIDSKTEAFRMIWQEISWHFSTFDLLQETSFTFCCSQKQQQCLRRGKFIRIIWLMHPGSNKLM